MKKRTRLLCMLLLCVLAFSACQSEQPEQFQVVTNPDQLSQQSVIPTEAPAINFDTGNYDPGSEENVDLPESLTGPQDNSTVPPQAASSYAGATPVVIDPIDKPTPTPAPELAISTYVVYDAKMGISFEGPVGWSVGTDETDTYSIVNPDPSMDFTAYLAVHKVTVSNTYTEAELKTQVTEMLSALKPNYNKFSPTKTASRTLLDKNGIYADYTGVEKTTGAAVWGRVHAVCVNKTLYILEMCTPQVYKEQYKDTVYSRFRRTVKITR